VSSVPKANEHETNRNRPFQKLVASLVRELYFEKNIINVDGSPQKSIPRRVRGVPINSTIPAKEKRRVYLVVIMLKEVTVERQKHRW
jgi:hypothetical protein